MAYKTGEPSWGWRRYMIFTVMGFASAGMWNMQGAEDTMMNRSLADGFFMLLMTFGAYYAGFPTAQDIAAIIATKSGTPYKDDPNVPPA